MQFLHVDLPDRLQYSHLGNTEKETRVSVINNVSEQEVAEALDRTDSSDQIQMLDAALAQLPPDERAIILLFYMKEKTIDEVATITGLTASNIKVKLYRIRKKLFFVLKGMEEQ